MSRARFYCVYGLGPLRYLWEGIESTSARCQPLFLLWRRSLHASTLFSNLLCLIVLFTLEQQDMWFRTCMYLQLSEWQGSKLILAWISGICTYCGSCNVPTPVIVWLPSSSILLQSWVRWGHAWRSALAARRAYEHCTGVSTCYRFCILSFRQ